MNVLIDTHFYLLYVSFFLVSAVLYYLFCRLLWVRQMQRLKRTIIPQIERANAATSHIVALLPATPCLVEGVFKQEGAIRITSDSVTWLCCLKDSILFVSTKKSDCSWLPLSTIKGFYLAEHSWVMKRSQRPIFAFEITDGLAFFQVDRLDYLSAMVTFVSQKGIRVAFKQLDSKSSDDTQGRSVTEGAIVKQCLKCGEKYSHELFKCPKCASAGWCRP